MKSHRPNRFKLLTIAGLLTVACVGQVATAQNTKPVPKPKPVLHLKAVGNEPFWGMTVQSQGIEYTRAGEATVNFPYAKPATAIGRPADLVQVYQLKTKNHQGVLVVNRMLDGAFCSDTMSDNHYPFSVTLLMDGQVFSGCASSPTYPVRPSSTH